MKVFKTEVVTSQRSYAEIINKLLMLVYIYMSINNINTGSTKPTLGIEPGIVCFKSEK